MAILEILKEPDARLRKISQNVEFVDDKIRDLMKDMLETMYHDNGVGLAAPQVNIRKRILVIDATGIEEDLNKGIEYPIFMVNPEIFWESESLVEASEGCLSVPEQYIDVLRSESIKVSYIDFDNQEKVLDVSGWLARIIQHEMDHLDGKLIIDYLSKLKKDIVVRKLKKIKDLNV